MKKVIFFFFIFVTVINFSACTLPESSPGKIEPLPIDSPPKEEIPNIPQENPHKYDQMVLARLNESFRLKVGQSAELEEKKIIITTQKVTEDSRCPSGGLVQCFWSGQVMVLLEIREGSNIPTSLQVSSIKPTVYNDLAIVLTKVEPENVAKSKPEGGIEPVPIAEANYTFYFEVKNASELLEEKIS